MIKPKPMTDLSPELIQAILNQMQFPMEEDPWAVLIAGSRAGSGLTIFSQYNCQLSGFEPDSRLASQAARHAAISHGQLSAFIIRDKDYSLGIFAPEANDAFSYSNLAVDHLKPGGVAVFIIQNYDTITQMRNKITNNFINLKAFSWSENPSMAILFGVKSKTVDAYLNSEMIWSVQLAYGYNKNPGQCLPDLKSTQKQYFIPKSSVKGRIDRLEVDPDVLEDFILTSTTQTRQGEDLIDAMVCPKPKTDQIYQSLVHLKAFQIASLVMLGFMNGVLGKKQNRHVVRGTVHLVPSSREFTHADGTQLKEARRQPVPLISIASELTKQVEDIQI